MVEIQARVDRVAPRHAIARDRFGRRYFIPLACVPPEVSIHVGSYLVVSIDEQPKPGRMPTARRVRLDEWVRQ